MNTAIGSMSPTPITVSGLVDRLRLSMWSLVYVLLAGPAMLLGIISVLAVPLALVTVGLFFALVAVPLTESLVGVHRRLGGRLLGRDLAADYRDVSDAPILARPWHWLSEGARWRDIGLLWFSATGGLVMSLLVPALLANPVVQLIFFLIDPGWLWGLQLAGGLLMLAVWWVATPALVRARCSVESSILGESRVTELERRVEQVEESRTETVDHSAAEVRRIERDLHDGAQARIAAASMTIGLAEKMIASDPAYAAELLREARGSSLGALDDLRSLVRDIRPPALADLGLAGAVEALVASIPMPITLTVDIDRALPEPIESAAYFAVAECLTNAVKHAKAGRGNVRVEQRGERLQLVVGDDGGGGADPAGSGLRGVARRLAAFDGTIGVDSPAGGPTVITMEIPCPTP